MTAAPWYDPRVWPTLVRWVALLPGTILVGTAAYVVSAFLNGIASMIPSGFVYLLAVGIAGSAMSVTAKYVAPAVKNYVGASVPIMFTIFGAVAIGNEAEQGVRTTTPLWFNIIFFTIGIAGTVFGALAPVNDEPRHSNLLHFSALVRWIAFLPVALVATLSILAVEVGVASVVPVPSLIVRVENSFLFPAVFIGVCVGIVPKGQRALAVILAIIPIVIAMLRFVFGIARPLMVPALESRMGYKLAFDESAWLQAVEAVALLAGALLPTAAAMREYGRGKVASGTAG